MRKTIKFTKISAAGNDFILVDNRRKVMPKDLPKVIQRWCDRKYGIGADGVILLEDTPRADFRMRYFNSDGSAAAMCGNGGRSVARFACVLQAAGKKMQFETDAGLIRAEILKSGVRLYMSEPRECHLDFTLRVEKKEFFISSIDTGVPHAVVFVTDIARADVQGLGRMIRLHRHFAPAGTNVNFVQVKDEHTILVRTYERGVEDETLACGTGATASAIIAGLRGLARSPVRCMTRGGDMLKISFSINESGDFLSPVSDVQLEGPAEIVFSGEVAL
jgi:diaminopimelate epimerase